MPVVPEPELVLRSEPGAVPQARHFARSMLPGYDEDLVADVELVVTELVTNATLHGQPPIKVRLTSVSTSLRLEVEDEGRALPLVVQQRADAMTGRGLSLVSALSATWGVAPCEPCGKVVWAELSLPRPVGPVSIGAPEMDLDAILAAWTDDLEPHRYTLRLGTVPTDLLLSAKAHIDNVVRELTLLRGGEQSTGNPLPAPIAALVQTVTEDFADARQEIKRQAMASAAAGEKMTSLELHLPLSAADAGDRYLAALAEADRYARTAHLLTLAPPRSHKVLRNWYVTAVTGQLRALAQGRDLPPVEPFAMVLANQVDQLARLELVSARLELLQQAGRELATAQTPERMATLVVEHATQFLGVSTARVYLLTDHGTLRLVGKGGQGVPADDPYDEFALDSNLPGALVARTGEALFMRSLAEIYAAFPLLSGYYLSERSLHILPLSVAGRSLGLLTLTFIGGELADEAQLSFVNALADLLAQGLGRLRAANESMLQDAALTRLLQAMVDAAQDGVLAVSPERKVLAVNRQFCDLWHLPPGSVRVGHTSPIFSQAQRAQIVDLDAFEDTLRWGHENPEQPQTLQVALVDGRVIEGYAAPIVDDQGIYLGRVWYLHDETARLHTESQKAQLVSELAKAQKAQRFLLDASAVLAQVTGVSETLNSLAQVAVPVLGDLCLIDVCNEKGHLTRAAVAHADPARAELSQRLRQFAPDPQGSHPGARAIREGRSLSAAEMDERFMAETSVSDEHLQLAKALGPTSYMAVPLLVEGRALGALTLVTVDGRRFGPEDLSLAEDLARRVALVIAKERRYDLEKAASHALQASLLPGGLPPVAYWQLAARYLPGTRHADVGGDFWDVLTLSDGDLALSVGDVVGHDMTAAATMAQLRSACRALNSQAGGPGELVDLLQRAWDQLDLERMATATFARLRRDGRRLWVASAGHPPPLIARPGRAEFAPVPPAAPLGAPPHPAVVWQANLAEDAVAVFFTDGLIQDRHRSIEDGLRLLARTVATAPTLAPDPLADHILGSLLGDDRGDDAALVIVG